MTKHPSHLLTLATRGAASRLRELADDLAVLLNACPDLRDAFDADELPISFIVRRDARRDAARTGRRKRPVSAAVQRTMSRRINDSWAERRAGPNK